MKNLLPGVTNNTMAAWEHVGKIDWKIQVIKERARGTINTLPYDVMPKLMVIKLMLFCVMWMNSLLVKSGVMDVWSQRELLSQQKLDANYTARLLLEPTARCIRTRILQTQLSQEQNGEFFSGPLETCRGATILCCWPPERKLADVNSQRCWWQNKERDKTNKEMDNKRPCPQSVNLQE